MNLAIIDCAIKTQSHNCFNRLSQHFNIPMTYHIPSMTDCHSIKTLKTEPNLYIIFGSASNVSDNLDWQIELGQLMKQKLEIGVPVLGICFGHQLMGSIFGADIDFVIDSETIFEGTREVEIIHPFCSFKRGEKLNLIISHYQEIKTLPNDFTHLATSKDCKYDIISHKEYPLISLQGHPEASQFFCDTTLKEKFPQETINKGLIGGITFLENVINSIKVNQKNFHKKL